MKGLVTLSLLMLMPDAAWSQMPGMPDGSRERAGLAPLARLVGTWEGPASAVVGGGRTEQATQHEQVNFGSGATVLIVRGTGRLKDGKVIHDATALIWYDAAANKLRMRAHRMEGIAIEPEIELKGDTLVWGFVVPGGRIRFTTVFTDSTWHEVGHFLREGAPPIQTMEMRLKKVK
jgi:hypothetical protein